MSAIHKQLKQQLIVVVYRYLKKKYHTNKFTVLFNEPGEPVYLQLEEINSQVCWQIVAKTNPMPANLKHGPLLAGLLTIIFLEPHGYGLHRMIDDYLTKHYPTGLWLSSRAPLFDALRRVLNQYTLDDLNRQDVISLTNRVQQLNETNKSLSGSLQTVSERLEALNKTNEKNQQEIIKLEPLRDEYASLRSQLKKREEESQKLQKQGLNSEEQISALSLEINSQTVQIDRLASLIETLMDEHQKTTEQKVASGNSAKQSSGFARFFKGALNPSEGSPKSLNPSATK